MNSFKDSLAFWTTIIGTWLGFLGLVRSYTWLTGIGALLLAGSFTAILYARRQRQLVLLAAVKVEGRSIDSLNIAGLRRRLNRTLVIQEASHLAQIDGEDLAITWQYSGYCRADQEAAMEFSIDTDNNVPFDKLDCFAYDLQHDAHRNHKIRPILIGPDGMSKKISVPFLEPLSARQPFRMLLKPKRYRKLGMSGQIQPIPPQHVSPSNYPPLHFQAFCDTLEWRRKSEYRGPVQPAALKKNLLESLVAGRLDVPLGIREEVETQKLPVGLPELDKLSGGLLRETRLAAASRRPARSVEAFWRAQAIG